MTYEIAEKLLKAATYKNGVITPKELGAIFEWANEILIDYQILQSVLDGDVWIISINDNGDLRFALTEQGKEKNKQATTIDHANRGYEK